MPLGLIRTSLRIQDPAKICTLCILKLPFFTSTMISKPDLWYCVDILLHLKMIKYFHYKYQEKRMLVLMKVDWVRELWRFFKNICDSLTVNVIEMPMKKHFNYVRSEKNMVHLIVPWKNDFSHTQYTFLIITKDCEYIQTVSLYYFIFQNICGANNL